MFFLFDWMFKVLNFLGLANKEGKLVFIGLDCAGKSTLLGLLKDGRITAVNPTHFPTSEELKIGGVTFTAWDVGGHREVRHLWANYFPAIDGIIYVVDAADHERLAIARENLDRVLSDPDIKHIPIAIFGNKIDVPGACSEEYLKKFFMLEGQTTGKGKSGGGGGGERNNTTTTSDQRPLEIFMCSFLKQTGYGDGFRWMADFF